MDYGELPRHRIWMIRLRSTRGAAGWRRNNDIVPPPRKVRRARHRRERNWARMSRRSRSPLTELGVQCAIWVAVFVAIAVLGLAGLWLREVWVGHHVPGPVTISNSPLGF